MLDSGFWILDTGYWILDSGFWILDRCWVIKIILFKRTINSTIILL
jgi:hypothetical protein